MVHIRFLVPSTQLSVSVTVDGTHGRDRPPLRANMTMSVCKSQAVATSAEDGIVLLPSVNQISSTYHFGSDAAQLQGTTTLAVEFTKEGSLPCRKACGARSHTQQCHSISLRAKVLLHVSSYDNRLFPFGAG